MNRPQKIRSPSFGGYDPRAVIGRTEASRLIDYDDPYVSSPPFDSVPPNGPPLVEPNTAQYPIGYRDHHPRQHPPPPLPANATATGHYPRSGREPFGPSLGSSQYKILCITNINPKIGDGPMKDALMSDFSRFGDISVSICHDNGERLAYIYFRSYEEAREARHTKARTILFDRPIEIEPIHEPRTSPMDSPPLPPPAANLQAGYSSRRRSLTPPEYYGMHHGPGAHPTPPPPIQPTGTSQTPSSAASGSSNTEQIPQSSRKSVPNYPHPPRPMSPPHGYPPHPMRYSGAGLSPPLTGPSMPYGRHYMTSEYLAHHPSPYSSPTHPQDQYRYYHQVPPSPIHGDHYPSGHSHSGPTSYPSYLSHYLPRERADRCIGLQAEGHMGRSPRSEMYMYQMEHRSYPPPPPTLGQSSHHSSRMSPSYMHSSSSYHQHQTTLSPQNPATPPAAHHPTPSNHQTSSTSVRKSPPHLEHPVRYMSREYRREKYSSESYLNEPEEGRPSRLIFVTKIDTSKSEHEIRDIFEPYGVIEELELRKVSPDCSSALIKYSSMDCAYKAKTALSGKYLGNSKCRITYGKVSASRRLWIGGLGSTTTMADLDDEFGRYGNIINLDYISGRPYAYVEFESANQAQFATQHLRGSKVANADRRMRIEYVDPVERNDKQVKSESTTGVAADAGARSHATSETWNLNCGREDNSTTSSRKRASSPLDNYGATKRLSHLKGDVGGNGFGDHRAFSRLLPPSGQHELKCDRLESNNNIRHRDGLYNGASNTRLGSGASDISASSSFLTPCLDHGSSYEACSTIEELVDCCSTHWHGKLVLRNFNFPSRLYMLSGKKSVIEKYIKPDSENGESCPVLKITQRWRLHPQPKLEEVKRRMQSGNAGMLIITSRPNDSPSNITTPTTVTTRSPQNVNQAQDKAESDIDQNDASSSKANEGSTTTPNEDASSAVSGPDRSPNTQSRPLKNLISYLEQKDAAGVISLNHAENNNETSTPSEISSKLLYAFPPGSFAFNLLKSKAPNLITEAASKEEFLLGVIVGGGSEVKI